MNLGRGEQALLWLLALAVAFGLGAKYALRHQTVQEEPVVEKKKEETMICVHVVGAVYHPGLYRFPQGSRVFEAVQKAGPRADADVDALNLAAVLEDQDRVLVPIKVAPEEEKGRANPASASGSEAYGATAHSPETGKININTAEAAVLEELPGIGPVLAERIVAYRVANGPFSSVDDLAAVSGIGEKKLDQLREYVCVR